MMPDDLDRLLNNALQTYTNVEPSSTLAGRIARSATLEAAPRRETWSWAAISPAHFAVLASMAASLVLLIALAGVHFSPKPQHASRPRRPSQPTLAAANSATLRSAQASPVRSSIQISHPAPHKKSTPRNGMRPLPPPPSPQERLLLAFVQQHPDEAANLAKAQQGDLAPLHIEPATIARLQVEPLTISPLP
jgi:hypothetical protein